MSAYTHQTVSALPNPLQPNHVYYVARAGDVGYDILITDAAAAPIALQMALIKGDPGGSEMVTACANAAAAADISADAASAAAVLAAAAEQRATAAIVLSDADRILVQETFAAFMAASNAGATVPPLAAAAALSADEAEAAAATAVAAADEAGAAAAAIPAGGAAGQVLTKASATDRHMVWSTPTVAIDLAAAYAWTGRHTWTMGAITTSQPMAMQQTWNNAAVAFTGRSFNAVDTASDVASLLDILTVGGASRWKVDKAGNATSVATIQGLTLQAESAGTIRMSGRFRITSAADGTLLLRNDGSTDFGLIQIGGSTSPFPAIKRDGANLRARLADDSADTAIVARNTAKAWVVFNGVTGSIVASFNVGSVTRSAAGKYTVAFSPALPTANYAVFVDGDAYAAASNSIMYVKNGGSRTTTALDVEALTYNGSGNTDPPFVQVVVFC